MTIGAAVGGALGVIIGSVGGAYRPLEPDPPYGDAVVRCLIEKGYDVTWLAVVEGEGRRGDLLARGTRGLRRRSFDARSRGHPLHPIRERVKEERNRCSMQARSRD